MIIVCPSCAANYEVPDESIGPAGRTVRCAACGTKWFAEQPPPSAAEPQDVLPPASPEPAEPAPTALAPIVDAEAASGAVRSIEAVARRGRQPRTARKKPRAALNLPSAADTGWFVVLASAAALILAVIYRDHVVQVAPSTARLFAAIGAPVNLRGMEFRELVSRVEFENGQPIVIVEGRIENLTNSSLAVPRLRLAVKGATGRELVSWASNPPRPTIAPRESLPFRTRLTTSISGGNEIEVRFLGQRDVPTGAIR